MSEAPGTALETRKPTLTPRQAISISLGGLGVGAVVLVAACTLYFVPFWQGMGWFAIAAFFLLTFPWVCLELETRNRAVRAHNLFVYFTIAIVIVVLLLQWKPKEEPFPKWAVAAIVIAGVAAYSVMARHAIANFRKWRHGSFRDHNAENT